MLRKTTSISRTAKLLRVQLLQKPQLQSHSITAPPASRLLHTAVPGRQLHEPKQKEGARLSVLTARAPQDHTSSGGIAVFRSRSRPHRSASPEMHSSSKDRAVCRKGLHLVNLARDSHPDDMVASRISRWTTVRILQLDTGCRAHTGHRRLLKATSRPRRYTDRQYFNIAPHRPRSPCHKEVLLGR